MIQEDLWSLCVQRQEWRMVGSSLNTAIKAPRRFGGLGEDLDFFR